jgi:hypothetical protein
MGQIKEASSSAIGEGQVAKIDARNQSPQWESGAAHTCRRIRGLGPDAEEPARNPVNITRNGDVVHYQEW